MLHITIRPSTRLSQTLGGLQLILSPGQRLRWLEDVLLFHTERVCGELNPAGHHTETIRARSHTPKDQRSVRCLLRRPRRGQRTHSHLQQSSRSVAERHQQPAVFICSGRARSATCLPGCVPDQVPEFSRRRGLISRVGWGGRSVFALRQRLELQLAW